MKKDSKDTMIRHGEPNKLDLAPQGSQIQMIGRDTYKIYEQTSPDEDNPTWELMGEYKINE